MGKVRVMKNGKQVASSQNLEVILRYQRQNSSIKKVTQSGKKLKVYYTDGAKVETNFASESVLKDWIWKKRRRGTFPSK